HPSSKPTLRNPAPRFSIPIVSLPQIHLFSFNPRHRNHDLRRFGLARHQYHSGTRCASLPPPSNLRPACLRTSCTDVPLLRSMPHLRRTLAILVRRWGWLRSPTFSSTSTLFCVYLVFQALSNTVRHADS